MNDTDKNTKAEDILTEDVLLDKSNLGTGGKGHDDNDDLHLAAAIYHTIRKQKKTLNPEQKELIGRRIATSIARYHRKRFLVATSAAATVLLIIGISALVSINRNESRIKAFAESSRTMPMSGNTRLILSGDEEIQINSSDSEIAYVPDGGTIRIDSTENVSQLIGSDKLVMNTVVVPYGKRTKITLSDNSTIWLNSGSKLIYPARFAKEKREVYLEGEAIFEVSHHEKHPFHVITRDLEVKVLGTVFNLSAYHDDPTTNTILVSGSVQLEYNRNSLFGKSKETMVPGMLAVYHSTDRNLRQTTVNPNLYTSWRDGYFIFEQHPLGEIIKKIARYYNVPVILTDPEMGSKTFSGRLNLRNSASQVLEVIAEIVDAKIETSDNQIIITRI
ncbi:FecR family protein [Gaoshiqia sp. Z1-71]|uniref:FecR family protein n=1 Tax=Gaoshiqia hydrogeniformans TaxID=3290090 RepID=UPI003BF7DC72